MTDYGLISKQLAGLIEGESRPYRQSGQLLGTAVAGAVRTSTGLVSIFLKRNRLDSGAISGQAGMHQN